ncbi:MAG: PIN domain-containing protein [Pseudanabaena sp.]|jgi:rRNA-processing protein FCF1
MADKKNGDKEQNIFVLNKIYPNAESVFAFRPKTLEQIKENCLVVLDTNVLLIPFDTGKESLQQIKSTYKRLTQAKRLVIPGRVAREFAKNRSEKLKTIHQQISLKSNLAINRPAYPLLESSTEYLKLIEMEKEIDNKISDYRKQVKLLLSKIKDWYWDDPVSSLYREIFSSDVVIDIDHNEQELISDLEYRQLHSIPPGFQDSAKEDRGIGDLLIWHTILELGRNRKQDIIFVSNDSKNDWWYQSEKQALYPRFELIDEYRQNSDEKTIRIINFSTFLQLFDASPEVVEEVRQEEVLSSIQISGGLSSHVESDISILYSQAEVAVGEWIRGIYTDCIIFPSKRFPDFIVQTPKLLKIGFEVKICSNRNSISHVIKIVSLQSQQLLAQGTINELTLVLISTEEDIDYIESRLDFLNLLLLYRETISIVLGNISPEGKFLPRLSSGQNKI